MHVCPAPHTTPQPPQLLGSLPTETQRPLQNEEPGGQAQVPLVQVVPMGQTTPHTPQLALSLLVLVHTPLQLTWPGGQVVVHTRATQAAPGAQARPHWPQLRGSFATSTQEPSGHWVNGGEGHIDTQLPLAHTEPGAQVRPHWPQLLGSLWSATQRPLQDVVPDGQPVHLPSWQVRPAAHSTLQPPQLLGSEF